MVRPLWVWSVAWTVVGCGSGQQDDGSDDLGGAWLLCGSDQIPVALDHIGELGFSAGAVVDGLSETHSLDAAYPDGTVVGVSLTLESSALDATYIDQWLNTGADTGPFEDDPDCPDYLQVDATLTLVTEDGQFADTFEVYLRATALEEATASGALELSELVGGYSPDTSGADGARLDLSNTFSTGGVLGSLTLVTEGSSGEAVWQSSDLVMEWPGT